jgi:membrane fusion protein (multidrug efflux system)
MFASVEVEAGQSRQALVVPATSVIFAPYGDSVFIVEQKKDEPAAQGEGGKAPPPAPKAKAPAPDGKPELVARQEFVRLGERRGDFVQVLNGLNGGETIVSNGAFKLRNNQPVMVNNDLAPPANFVPVPVDR